MQDTDAMIAFYRALGFDINEQPHVVSVYAGDQMINLHRPATWQRAGFTFRAPNAQPPCGDLCFVWDGTPDALPRPSRRGGSGDRRGTGRRARVGGGAMHRASTSATPTGTCSSS